MQPLGENTVNTPAFLGKLWKMVNDPSTDHLISWSPSCNSFIIQNQAQFWYDLLPLYYKHNNMSSFVRQLNMYGFHKMSTVDNGTMDSDRDEIQFTHPYFQKDQPELLRNIKRKATPAKTTIESTNNTQDLAKVLTDVKQLRGKQANVDNQLNAMKHENALLWREVAILRQKHLKQQKIVNKLIQFLVTLVQPSRMTVGVKRGYQLMLNESPSKKSKMGKNSSVEGPTIHELDNELDLSPNLYDEESPMINSPATSTNSQAEIHSPLQAALSTDQDDTSVWPQTIDVSDLDLVHPDLNEDDTDIITLSIPATNGKSQNDNEKVFLNPTTQDTLLSNLMKSVPVENANEKNEKNQKNEKNEKIDIVKNEILKPVTTAQQNSMAIATRDKYLGDIMKNMPGTSDCFGSDLSTHIESTQNELEQFKDILNGYNSFVDANALLGELNKMSNYRDDYLFTEDAMQMPYDLNLPEKHNNSNETTDPMVSGSELLPYAAGFDFTELFDESVDGNPATPSNMLTTTTNDNDSINTPQIVEEEPIFPAIQ